MTGDQYFYVDNTDEFFAIGPDDSIEEIFPLLSISEGQEFPHLYKILIPRKPINYADKWCAWSNQQRRMQQGHDRHLRTLDWYEKNDPEPVQPKFFTLKSVFYCLTDSCE
jgi:hypothetical protein